jgi:hypothetical protein
MIFEKNRPRTVREPHEIEMGPAPSVFLFGFAALAVLFTLIFARWTATSVYSFPRFLLALLLFIYVPGRFLLDRSPWQLLPLEHLSLSLVLGLLASSLIYWAAVFVGIPALFLPWPLIAGAGCAFRVGRQWGALPRRQPILDGSHLLLLGVLALSMALLAVIPTYYHNLALLPNDELQYLDIADVYLHLGIANELTHSVPPQMPFLAGQPLAYHYAADLPTAFFSTFAGLSTLDLTVRFMPTFFLAMTGLAIFSFSRAWLQSSLAAALATFLVLLGEDFAFIPGLWFQSNQPWPYQYFGIPTVYSLYACNPMLPALGVLFAGLFCFLKLIREGGKTWLLGTAVLFAAVLEYKVFIAAQLLLVLTLAALVYAGRAFFLGTAGRQECLPPIWKRLLTLLGLTGLFVLLFALPMWQTNAAGAQQTMRLHPTQFLPEFVRQGGLAGSHWGDRVLHLFDGHITLKGLATCLLVVLPVYLVGSLGARVVGLPRLLKELCVPTEVSAVRFFLACFVCLGPLLTLTCVVGSEHLPVDRQYNNSVWFYVQSKHLAWMFAVESLCAATWLRTRGLRVAAGLLLNALAVPATVQFIWCVANSNQSRMEVFSARNAEVMTFLAGHASPGEVAMARRETGLPIAALTRCRSPISPLMPLSRYFLAADALRERERDWQDFWQRWKEGSLQADTLRKYHVNYLVVDKDEEDTSCRPFEKQPGTGSDKLLLRCCFENEGFRIYQIVYLRASDSSD